MMLLYKVIIAQKDKKEILFQSIAAKAILPHPDLLKNNPDTLLIIQTCDSTSLTTEEREIYQNSLSKKRAA